MVVIYLLVNIFFGEKSFLVTTVTTVNTVTTVTTFTTVTTVTNVKAVPIGR